MTNEIYERDYTKCASKYLPIGDIESSPLKYLDLDNAPTVPHVMLPHALEKRGLALFVSVHCFTPMALQGFDEQI